MIVFVSNFLFHCFSEHIQFQIKTFQIAKSGVWFLQQIVKHIPTMDEFMNENALLDNEDNLMKFGINFMKQFNMLQLLLLDIFWQ